MYEPIGRSVHDPPDPVGRLLFNVFAVLRTALDVSDATLSKHVKTLVASGYIVSHKAASADRSEPKSWEFGLEQAVDLPPPC